MTRPKILVANRGEIAIRVLRTCRKMGLKTVAVYSEADKNTLPVGMADESICIGPAPTNQSYLVADKIIEAFRRTKATAIHPGFGFLSENSKFVKQCESEGIKFIGPSSKSIELMGDKIQARRQMNDARVPVVPGTFDPLQSVDEAKTIAEKIKYPVMLKATAGGGGKGMRKVDDPNQMEACYQAARSEAEKFFANGDLYCEKFIQNPHHIEVQVFGYGRDDAVHLFERECSIQRRHQKVIEEAPSPLINSVTREKLTSVAIAGAKAIDYRGAGTMEFVADDSGNFYFMEMNTRLQVEHTVTEWITGVDLVEEQIRLALGMPLQLRDQTKICMNGNALQCRIYAEDPIRFYPSPGKLHVVRWPQGPGVRVDTGIESGDEVSMYYDPMIAKLSTWGRTRDEAISRMRVALEETVILGIETNIPFHLAVLGEKTFQGGNTNTGYIDANFPQTTREKILSDGRDPKDFELAARLALGFGNAASEVGGLSTRRTVETAWQIQGLRDAVERDPR